MKWLMVIILVARLLAPLEGVGMPIVRAIECMYAKSSAAKVSVLNENEDSTSIHTIKVAGGKVMNVTVCLKPSEFCYALWKVNEDFSFNIISQGCWESSGSLDCLTEKCVSSGKPNSLHKSHFCCCQDALCNMDIYIANQTNDDVNQAPEPLSEEVSLLGASSSTLSAMLVITLLCIAAITGGLVSIVLYCSQKANVDRKSMLNPNQENSDQPLIPGSSPESLKLSVVVGQGRYGTVWQASLEEKDVAVKVFYPASRCYFTNEKDIYCLSHISHDSIIGFISSFESINSSRQLESKLILEYATKGCLQEFLRQNTIDFETMIRMGCSVSRGLAFLHSDFQKNGQCYSIVHRDLNSRNVLVKSDLSCCLCDFGFALQVSGSQYIFNGEQQHAETSSLSDVGTLRYMAPEVLEGAVNLRECESSLKQVDVYALALVLWEISYRCRDLYPLTEVNPYCLPYEESIGPHATLEQMKIVVCRNKIRPNIPEVWKDTNPSVRLLKETLMDAWDSDAEARLTSLCVEERWTDLKAIWDREKLKKGLSPNLRSNATQLGRIDYVLCKNDANRSPLGIRPASEDGERESIIHHNKNREIHSQTLIPLQPHQGRNPCLERNTMRVVLEMSDDRNPLVERSSKADISVILNTVTSEPVPSNGITPSLSIDHTDPIRVVHPIPYVQNAVRDVSSLRTVKNTEESSHNFGQLFNEFLRGRRSKRPTMSVARDLQLESANEARTDQVLNLRKSKLNNQEYSKETINEDYDGQELQDVACSKATRDQNLIYFPNFSNTLSCTNNCESTASNLENPDSRTEKRVNHHVFQQLPL